MSRQLFLRLARPRRAETVLFGLLGVASLLSLALAAGPMLNLLRAGLGGNSTAATPSLPVAKRPVSRLSFWWGQAKADTRSLAAACRFVLEPMADSVAAPGDRDGRSKAPTLAGQTNAAPSVPRV